MLKNLENKFIYNKNGVLRKSVERIEYLDGSIYLGEIRDRKREGKGIYYFANKEVYGGEWNNDALHGKGVKIYLKMRRKNNWILMNQMINKKIEIKKEKNDNKIN